MPSWPNGALKGRPEEAGHLTAPFVESRLGRILNESAADYGIILFGGDT